MDGFPQFFGYRLAPAASPGRANARAATIFMSRPSESPKAAVTPLRAKSGFPNSASRSAPLTCHKAAASSSPHGGPISPPGVNSSALFSAARNRPPYPSASTAAHPHPWPRCRRRRTRWHSSQYLRSLTSHRCGSGRAFGRSAARDQVARRSPGRTPPRSPLVGILGLNLGEVNVRRMGGWLYFKV